MPDEKKSSGHHDGSSTRAFTAEQKEAVIRVRKCQTTAFYDILGLESVRSTCSDADIKKAYRKLSLLTHPDKNGYAGADEAFKMVSRAFQVLSDEEKKKRYDKFGGDPESRFGGGGGGGAAASPFSGFAQQRGGGGGGMRFEEEISPEELFRQFFGGGGAFGGGGPFGE
jgi:DnaJ homolog subfamily B member 12